MSAINVADEGFLENCQRLRLVAFSCHEAGLRALDEWAYTNIRGLRFHLYEYFLETPSPISSPHADPNLFVPFVDREVAARGLCLAVPPDEKADQAFLEELVTLIHLATTRPDVPFTLPHGFASHLDPLELLRRLSRVGPLTRGVLAKGLYDAWSSQEKAEEENCHRSVNRNLGIAEMHGKITDQSLAALFRLGWANIFAILYTPLVARAKTKDTLFQAAVAIASSRAFYGVLTVLIEIPERYDPINSRSVLTELFSLVHKVYL